MSQYPSPYQPPQPPGPPGQQYGYDYSIPPGGSAAAKRAAILLFILGGLLTALGACNMLSTVMVSAQELLDQQTKFMPPGQNFPMTAERFKQLTLVVAGFVFTLGLVLIIVGTFVRRGGRVAINVAMTITVLLLLFFGLFLLMSVISAIVQPVMLAITCVLTLPTALLTLLLTWLIQASRAGDANAQYAQQYWQYAYQQQMYQQQRSAIPPNAGFQPPPPPPQPPPPRGSDGPSA